MSSPWKHKPREAHTHFAECEITAEERPNRKGDSTHVAINVYLAPIEEGQQMIERFYIDFWPNWEFITKPSVMRHVGKDKIFKTIEEMSNKKQFISYRWTEYKGRDQGDIQYWRENDPDKLAVDDQGRSYKPYIGLDILDIFPDEESWRQAALEAGPAPHSSSSPLSEQPSAQPQAAKPDDALVKAAQFALPIIVSRCGTDMAALEQSLQHPPLNSFDIHHDEVRWAVAAFVAKQAGQEVEKTEKLLAEINSHFGDIYLELNSRELILQLDEIPF